VQRVSDHIDGSAPVMRLVEYQRHVPIKLQMHTAAQWVDCCLSRAVLQWQHSVAAATSILLDIWDSDRRWHHHFRAGRIHAAGARQAAAWCGR